MSMLSIQATLEILPDEILLERTSGGKAIFPPPTFFEKNYMVRISIKF